MTEAFVPLMEVKRHDVLGLPREVMEMVGPAAQTFAAYRTFARNTGETFASLAVIADKACLPRATVKRHINVLREAKLLKHKGRQRRRTATYAMDLWYIGGNAKAKFAMLPRWAALMLPTWAERAVFALVVSLDSLCRHIDEGNGGAGEDDPQLQQYAAAIERREFSLSTLEKQSGLSRRSICHAKVKLQERGLLIVEPGLYEYRTMPDSLFLNPDFLVPNELLHPREKMSHCQTDNASSVTPKRGLKVSHYQGKSEPDLEQKWTRPREKMSHLLNGSIKPTLKRTLNGTAVPADVRSQEEGEIVSEKKTRSRNPDKCDTSSCLSTKENQSNAIDLSAIDLDERRQQLSEKFKAMLTSNGEVEF